MSHQFSPIPPDDRGACLGDGLFETLLVSEGRLIAEAAHWARLVEGARILGLPEPDPIDLHTACAPHLPPTGRHALRLSYSAGSGGRGLARPDPIRPRIWVTVAPAPPWHSPAWVVMARTVRRNDQSPLSRTKSLNYGDNLLARREAEAVGADEALMLNTRGHLACGSVSTLYWLAGETLFTPALTCGALAGVYRAFVLRAAIDLGLSVREVSERPDALDQAEALMLSNSLTGLRPVVRYEDRDVPANNALDALQTQAALIYG
ncbi:MAG: aminotransferase class IV [Asticcacaulis sp.]